MDSNDFIYNQYGANIQGILQWIWNLFTGSGGTVDSALGTIFTVWQVYSVIAFIISALLLFGLIYAKMRHAELEHHEHEMIHHDEEHYRHQHAHGSKNQRWEDAVTHTESDNPNDWRLAIIEADIILEGVLDSLGLSGLTIGDKLKKASPTFFKTLDDAWQAHRVRNEIAHKGADFVLTKRIAIETLERYRRVFEEFSAI